MARHRSRPRVVKRALHRPKRSQRLVAPTNHPLAYRTIADQRLRQPSRPTGVSFVWHPCARYLCPHTMADSQHSTECYKSGTSSPPNREERNEKKEEYCYQDSTRGLGSGGRIRSSSDTVTTRVRASVEPVCRDLGRCSLVFLLAVILVLRAVHGIGVGGRHRRRVERSQAEMRCISTQRREPWSRPWWLERIQTDFVPVVINIGCIERDYRCPFVPLNKPHRSSPTHGSCIGSKLWPVQ